MPVEGMLLTSDYTRMIFQSDLVSKYTGCVNEETKIKNVGQTMRKNRVWSTKVLFTVVPIIKNGPL